MADKEKINIQDFYDLRRKLWVEAMASALTRPSGHPGEMTSISVCAQIADAAVEEFDKRFRAVC